MKNRLGLLITALSVCLSGAIALGQSSTDYDSLVQQGKTQLQAGNSDSALTAANAAIKTDASRWEAYAVAGGALINLKKCDEAKADLNEAIKLAPDAKQSGLRTLSTQCAPLSDSGGTASGPTYGDTVRYIQAKIKDAGYSMGEVNINGPIGNSIGVAVHTTYDDAVYTFAVDACRSMTVTSTLITHTKEYGDDNAWHNYDGEDVYTTTVPFKSVESLAADTGQRAPAIFSTHNPAQNASGEWVADGYDTGPVLAKMENMLPLSAGIAKKDHPHQDWHDTVWIVPKDLDVSMSYAYKSGDDSGKNGGHITETGVPVPLILFAETGKGESSTHVAKAIQHLIDVCVNHPDQGPKDLF